MVVRRGDELRLRGRLLGTIAGFDECHLPNHHNIIVDAQMPLTAGDVNLRVDDLVTFRQPG